MFDGEKSKTERIGLMIDAVAKAAAGDLSIRLETSDQADELDSLAEAINVMLDAVQESRSGSRQTDNATPETKVEDNRLYENLLDAFASVDLNGQIQETNATFQALLGYTAEELRRLTYKDLTPEKWHAFENHILEEQVMVQGYSQIYEKEYRRKDGTVFPVELRTFLIRADNRQPVGLGTIVRDISTHKQLEKELYLTQYCVEKASVGIHRTGPDGRFISVNEKFCKNLGYTREELCQMRVHEIDPDFSHEDWLAHRQGLRTKGPQTFETVHQRKDGTTFPVEIIGSYLEYENEGFSFAFTRDITERKQMEEQLIQARKMEAIGQLAGGIAHHFNNMLAVILGYVELIKARLPPNDPSLMGILAIEKAAIHISTITRQLLGFSRKQMITPQLLNLNELIATAKTSLARLMGDDIDLRFYPGQGLWQIKFDPAQIDQILVNLALNARDAMPNGGNLTLETENISLDEAFCQNHPELKPGPYVRLTLSDNGVGMDQETLSHIFEPFFTTKAVGQGTGLGLATIYGIIKQNDGVITVHSEPGQGTTFKIYFPTLRPH